MRRLVWLWILLLSGCVATPYQDLQHGEGVVAERMSDRTIRVTALGNSLTSSTQVLDFLLVKAAESTIENGGTHFAVVDATDLSQTRIVSSPGIFIGSVYLPPSASLANSPGAAIMIAYGIPKDAASAILPGMFDAGEVIRNIGPRVYASRRQKPAPPKFGNTGY